ncbi:MAG: bacteriohemerythrin [Gallionella sp.]
MITDTVIFPWNANFETGIAVIDKQHHKLVELLNQLARYLALGVNESELNRVFDALADYAVYHFKTEEAIWKKYLSADEMLIAHEKTHQDFVGEVFKLKDEYDAQSSDKITDKIVSFLTHWLAFHILESDKHMAKIVLFIQQGMSVSEAKEQGCVEMSGAMRVLIETVLAMYDCLSSRTVQLMREITERQRVEEGLRLSKSVIESTLEAIVIADANGMIVDINPSFCLDVQLSHEQLVGMDIRQLKQDWFRNDENIWGVAGENGHWAGEIRCRDVDGKMETAWLALSTVKDAQRVITHYVGVLSSVSKLIQRQEGLEEAANHDALTGLLNRRLLHDRLAQAILRSNRSAHVLAVCYLDLDGFKLINDTLGHKVGDEVLCRVAGFLKEILRGDDTVVRMGGDEFVLLLGDLEREEDVALLLNRLLKEIAQPIKVKNKVAQVSASIGISCYPLDSIAPKTLLEQADVAMYIAKNNGKSRYHFYS